jgi:N-terminal domain of reverse transcriptase
MGKLGTGVPDATAVMADLAASGSAVNGPEGLPDWDAIDWRHQEEQVRRLQQRIFKAEQEGNWKQVRNLQKLLLRSRANTLVSVRRVTQHNAGRRTPGVDRPGCSSGPLPSAPATAGSCAVSPGNCARRGCARWLICPPRTSRSCGRWSTRCWPTSGGRSPTRGPDHQGQVGPDRPGSPWLAGLHRHQPALAARVRQELGRSRPAAAARQASRRPAERDRRRGGAAVIDAAGQPRRSW